MAWFEVVCLGDVRETYHVEADSYEDAQNNWMNGYLVNSESESSEVYSIRELN